MSSRRAGSVLLYHLGPRVFGRAAPSAAAAAPRPLLSLNGGAQGGSTVWARLLSISASEAQADVAEVYASNEDYASSKARAATIGASEARADVAEVYASKVIYANLVEVKSAVAEEASKPKKGEWKASKPGFVAAASDAKKAGVAEAQASKENSGSVAAAKAEVVEADRDGEFEKGKSLAESSYWGIAPSRLVNKDGVEWKWSCFRAPVAEAPTKSKSKKAKAPAAADAADAPGPAGDGVAADTAFGERSRSRAGRAQHQLRRAPRARPRRQPLLRRVPTTTSPARSRRPWLPGSPRSPFWGTTTCAYWASFMWQGSDEVVPGRRRVALHRMMEEQQQQKQRRRRDRGR